MGGANVTVGRWRPTAAQSTLTGVLTMLAQSTTSLEPCSRSDVQFIALTYRALLAVWLTSPDTGLRDHATAVRVTFGIT